MSKKRKTILRLLKVPKDFTWDELEAALVTLGFEAIKNSKTGGSRRKFYHKGVRMVINLLKPHPSNIVKGYAIRQVIEKLKETRLI